MINKHLEVYTIISNQGKKIKPHHYTRVADTQKQESLTIISVIKDVNQKIFIFTVGGLEINSVTLANGLALSSKVEDAHDL